MQFTLLIFSLLALFLSGCNSQSPKNFTCNYENLFFQGLKDGERGLNYSKSVFKKCSQDTKKNKVAYQEGHEMGLKSFCSYERANQRALMQLEKEKVCEGYVSYKKGFARSLDNHCSTNLAQMDAQTLKPSNKNCLKDKDYKKRFYSEITSLCTKKFAYQQGYKDIPMNSYCLNLDNKKQLKQSYQSGLQDHLRVENKHLEKKAARLSSQLRELKKLKVDDRQRQSRIKKKIDKISKDYLETQHSIEKNRAQL